MKNLPEENFELCHQYLNLINVIEEGFTYVISSFTDLNKTEGDLVLFDIIHALTRIAQTNTLLEQVLADDTSVQQAIADFQNVTNAAFKLDGNFDNYHMKLKIVNGLLYPSFSDWNNIVQGALGKYVIQ